jgi:hypothetical protein
VRDYYLVTLDNALPDAGHPQPGVQLPSCVVMATARELLLRSAPRTPARHAMSAGSRRSTMTRPLPCAMPRNGASGASAYSAAWAAASFAARTTAARASTWATICGRSCRRWTHCGRACPFTIHHAGFPCRRR